MFRHQDKIILWNPSAKTMVSHLRERNFTEELQQIDEEMEQVGEALSKDKELKKIEEEMDL